MKNRICKVLIMTIVVLGITMFITGCGLGNKETELTNEDGEMLELTIDQLTDSGFYAYNTKQKIFVPVMSGAEKNTSDSFLSSEAEFTAEKAYYCWCGSKDADLVGLIPQIDNKNKKLVMYMNEDGDMPDEYALIRYKQRGYTIGVSLTFGETGNRLFVDTNTICETSMAASEFKDITKGQLRIYKINNSKDLPKENVDTRLNMLLGLEKDKKYQIGFFDGTEYVDMDLIADTAVFEAVSKIELADPARPTDKGFFYIDLPKNLKNGYYYINNVGLFRYTGEYMKEQ